MRRAARALLEAHKHSCPLLPTAIVFVSYGIVLIQVQVQVGVEVQEVLSLKARSSLLPLGNEPIWKLVVSRR
jgi:hypothetical protein